MNNKHSKIFLAGHRGLVGSAIQRRLEKGGYTNLILRTHSQLDLTRQADVEDFFEKERPEIVILAAAKVGGIVANSTYPADFLTENLSIALNVIRAAYLSKVTKLINLGSSCIYPKLAPQPMKEEYLLTGPLEVTNEAYAVAKIAAIRLCKHFNDQYGTNFISAMPTNLYGPGDNYDLTTSHVLPAMVRRLHEGKLKGGPVVLWGDGSPFREFLYSDDLADAVVYLLENKNYSDVGEFINVGSGKEISIRRLAELIAKVVGYTGEIRWDTGKPNGTPRKLMDSERLFRLGWTPRIELEEGLQLVYQDYLRSLE